MLIQINFQYLHEASSVFFMVVLMQYITQQITFFTIIDNQININYISVPVCWLNDIMIMHFYYLNPVVLKALVLKYGNFHHLGLCKTKRTDSGNSLICWAMQLRRGDKPSRVPRL